MNFIEIKDGEGNPIRINLDKVVYFKSCEEDRTFIHFSDGTILYSNSSYAEVEEEQLKQEARSMEYELHMDEETK